MMLRSVAAFTVSRSSPAIFARPLLFPPLRLPSSRGLYVLRCPDNTTASYARRGGLLVRKEQEEPNLRLLHSGTTMTHKVLVPIAEDSEELEAVAIIDTLRRAGNNERAEDKACFLSFVKHDFHDVTVAGEKGCSVTVASVGSSPEVRMSRKVRIVADKLISAVEHEHFDMIAIPGGMPGAEHCRDCSVLTKLLQKQRAEKKWIAAICASPAVVLHTHGLLDKEKAVCYPSFMEKLPPECRGEGRVCVSNKLVTSVGPGTAVEFALKLVEVLVGAEASKKVASGMVASS